MGNFDTQIEYKPVIEPPVEAGGTQKSDKMTVGAGSHKWEVNVKDGMFIGGETFADAKFGVNFLGEMFASLILIKNVNGEILIDSNSSTGDYVQLINSTLNTQEKEILGEYTFEGSGAIKIATDANNGLWLSPSGILGKKAGVTTFALDVNGNLTMKGTLLVDSVIACNINADLINAGTLIGRTVKATGGSGVDTWLNNNGQLLFRYGNSTKAYMQSDSAGRLIIDGDHSITLRSDGETDDIILQAYARVDIQSEQNIYNRYNNKNDGSDCRWYSNGNERMILNQDGALTIDNVMKVGTGMRYDVGTATGDSPSTFNVVTWVWCDGGDLKHNYRTIKFTGGIMVNLGSEQQNTQSGVC